MNDLVSADGAIRISRESHAVSATLEAIKQSVPIFSNVPGTTLLKVQIEGEEELLRLALFQGEIDDVLRWCDLTRDDSAVPHAREAAALTAIVRFVGCFDGTRGLRRKPLSKKAIYESADRRLIEVLKRIRNTEIAHDDQRYPGSLAFYLVDAEANAVWVSAIQLSGQYSSSIFVDDISRLGLIAKQWLVSEFAAKARELVDAFNALPHELRLKLKFRAPPYAINIEPEAIELGLDDQ